MTSSSSEHMHKAILHGFVSNVVQRVAAFRVCSPQGNLQPDSVDHPVNTL